MKPLIAFQDVHKRFGRTEAVRGLNLDVAEGSIVGFLGPNGAGKTTTIQTLLNLLRPDSGSIRVLDTDSRRLSPREFRQIGYVSENQELPDWMTVEGFVNYLRPMYPTWDDTFCARLLEQFDLPRRQRLRNLSRGMRMKAALLGSLAYRPRLVVLDEPFSGLDPLVRDEFIRGLLELTEQEGWTVFLSSHDVDEVERLCDTIAVIHEGRLRLNEPVDSLQSRFRRVEVQCSAAIDAPRTVPAPWRHLEIVGRTASFTHASFIDEGALRAEITPLLPGATRIHAVPLALREIIITLSRDLRSGSCPVSRPTPPAT